MLARLTFRICPSGCLPIYYIWYERANETASRSVIIVLAVRIMSVFCNFVYFGDSSQWRLLLEAECDADKKDYRKELILNKHKRIIGVLALLTMVVALGIAIGGPSSVFTATAAPTGRSNQSALPQATPTAGTLSQPGQTLTYTGGPHFVSNPSITGGELICNEVLPCDDFALTVIAPAGYENTHNFRVQIDWENPATDFDLYILDNNGTVLASAASSNNPEVAFLPVVAGTNVYTVRVVPLQLRETPSPAL